MTGYQLSRLWDSSKKDEKDARGKDKRGKKLSVEYEYPDDLQAVAGRLAESSQQSDMGDAHRGALGHDHSKTGVIETPGSPEAIFAELQATRKKYDAVRAFDL